VGAPAPGSLRRPAPAAFGICMVGEPGQSQQFDFLFLRAIRPRRRLQLAKPRRSRCLKQNLLARSVP